MFSRVLAFLILFALTPLLVSITILIIISDGFPIIFKQKRVGLNNSFFYIYKFRTMKNNTPNIATHLLKNPEKHVLIFGNLLRSLSLDELPNLINIIKGDIVFVGPRPALSNQDDLIQLRIDNGIDKLKPGVTGWAQINGRDNISMKKKVELEKYYLRKKSVLFDTKILILTFLKLFFIKNDITH